MTHLKSCQFFADGQSMRRTPTDSQFIIITLLLVSLLGVRTAYSLIDEEELVDVAAMNSIEISGDSSGRAPASIPAKLSQVKPSLHSMKNMDLSCAENPESAFKVTGQFIQFKGKNCLKNFKQDHMQIVNKSNGYTASIFPFGKDQYQTDMIQLMNGENEITIRYDTPTGAKFEKTIKVTAPTI